MQISGPSYEINPHETQGLCLEPLVVLQAISASLPCFALCSLGLLSWARIFLYCKFDSSQKKRKHPRPIFMVSPLVFHA